MANAIDKIHAELNGPKIIAEIASDGSILHNVKAYDRSGNSILFYAVNKKQANSILRILNNTDFDINY